MLQVFDKLGSQVNVENALKTDKIFTSALLAPYPITGYMLLILLCNTLWLIQWMWYKIFGQSRLAAKALTMLNCQRRYPQLGPPSPAVAIEANIATIPRLNPNPLTRILGLQRQSPLCTTNRQTIQWSIAGKWGKWWRTKSWMRRKPTQTIKGITNEVGHAGWQDFGCNTQLPWLVLGNIHQERLSGSSLHSHRLSHRLQRRLKIWLWVNSCHDTWQVMCN